MSASPLVLPPVRLLPADVLARQALAAPLLDRALRLTRWAGAERRVGGTGELLDEELLAAADELGLSGDDAVAYVAQAWGVAVDTGLLVLEIEESEAAEEGAEGEAGETEGEAGESVPPGEAAGRAVPGEVFTRLTEAGEEADPGDVLDLWGAALDCALSDATAPDLDNLPVDIEGGPVLPGDGGPLGEGGWDPEEEAELLDTALLNLYALTALDDGTHEGEEGVLPLPVLAASLVVPEEMEQPSEAVLEEVTAVMMLLDGHFRLLAPTGLLEYEPMDESLVEEVDPDHPGGPGADGAPEADEIARYGLVRITPLGVHGVRERLVEAGAVAPVLGDLAGAPAADLLTALTDYPEHSARVEALAWLEGRAPEGAARELLAAARGDDADAPGRRLKCQQALALLGPEAEPALREVLDDKWLGGLARVWLTEQGRPDVPAPGPDMVFWLTVDTLAAQIAADDDPEDLGELVRDLVDRHEGFFAAAWRVDHPATAAVLEAMGRLHPDRKVAKEARKAAFKARSREGTTA